MTELLSACGVSRSFGATRALKNLSVAVASGELLGIVGPDGAGKTTLLRALTGLISVDVGDCLVDGTSWNKADPTAREQLGYMPQHYGLYTDLSVDENLQFFADLFDLPRRVFSERRTRLLSITRLAHAHDRPAGALSGGMYKKLAIACALLHKPRVLVLDEPTNGVDPVSRRELWDLLHEFVEEGMGVVISTPYMDEASRCSRVMLLHKGESLALGEPSSLVDALTHPVFEVECSRRSEVVAFLESDPRVLAVTPAGERLRTVLLSSSEDEVLLALASLGASVKRTRPDFEDLYLALLPRRPSVAEAVA